MAAVMIYIFNFREFNGSVDQEMKVDDSDLDEVIKMVDNVG